MHEHLAFVEEKRLERVARALTANNMQAHVVNSAADVLPLLRSLLPAGATVANGGSETLVRCGVFELLRSGDYDFLDRDAPDIDHDKLFRQVFSADAYLASANAVTMQGEIYEIDGRANRVAAIAYGPASVILVVGRNKIVPDIAAARQRNADISGPANARRVGVKTPCATTGLCIDCDSPQRICCTELVLRRQQVKDRVKVILVNEELGF